MLADTGSTNDDARAWAAEGAPHGACVIADTQSKGRGRHGRSWSSPSGDSLAISIVVRPSVSPAHLPLLSLVAGLAARAAVARRVPTAGVKWPNDIVLVEADGSLRKIAGILIEASLAGSRVEHAIVGIGINVARREFPDELAPIATSLARAGASDLDRASLAIELLSLLDEELAAFERAPRAIAARLREHDALCGRAVLLDGDSRGVADGIDESGRLRVRTADGVVLANAGEVRLDRGGAGT